MKKILAIYYSQSGQGKELLDHTLSPFIDENDIEIKYEEIQPIPAFSFPWTVESFMQTFPESVEGTPCKLSPLCTDPVEHFDLVFIVWQPWYLSPSIPIHAFFQSSDTQKLLSGKRVITITGCRNMWIMAHQKIKSYIRDCGSELVGNIVFRDKSPNLLSVLTIAQWMLTGKKQSVFKFLPPAGVSDEDIRSASKFGEIIFQAVKSNCYGELQNNLLKKGAIQISPSILSTEKTGQRIFPKWSRFILKKGAYASPERRRWLMVFKNYLLVVIYLVSPLITLANFLIRPFRLKAIKEEVARYSSVD